MTNFSFSIQTQQIIADKLADFGVDQKTLDSFVDGMVGERTKRYMAFGKSEDFDKIIFSRNLDDKSIKNSMEEFLSQLKQEKLNILPVCLEQNEEIFYNKFSEIFVIDKQTRESGDIRVKEILDKAVNWLFAIYSG